MKAVGIKLDSFIISQTEYSRRDVLELVKNQSIKVNGQVIESMTYLIRPKKDIVTIQGVPVSSKLDYFYYKFNKPKGIISTLEDPEGRPCLTDFIQDLPKSIFPIGRLDRNTTGLLLFTNDGNFAQQISHPKFHLSKQYQLMLDRVITHRDLERLSAGILLEDGPVQFESAYPLSAKELEVTISEGRNHLIRRTFEFLGYEVTKLRRIAIGPIQLGSLPEGKYRALTKGEIRGLKS